MIFGIKDKIIGILGILLIIAGIAIFGYRSVLISTEKERDRFEQNSNALEKEAFVFKTANGQIVSENISLTKTNNELFEDNDSLKKKVLSMKIKPKNVTSINTGTVNVNTIGTIIMHDTVVIDKEIERPFKTGLWNDAWATVILKQINDTISFQVIYSDTATIIGSRYKIGKWKIKNIFVKRKIGYKISAMMGCPYSTIQVKQILIQEE